jgi:alanine racemase
LPRFSPHIEISLDAVVENLHRIRRSIPPQVGTIAVVKDQAYGCGALPVARELERNGVGFFAVARIEEARALRRGGIVSPILMLGYCSAGDARWASAHGTHLLINDLAQIRIFASAKSALHLHCNVDTGMGRLGILPHEIGAVAELLQANPSLHLVGLCTHAPCADQPATATVARQVSLLRDALAFLQSHGFRPSLIHAANSAAAFRFPESLFTMIRPGIALYGCNPDPAQDFGAQLRAVASLKGMIVKVKEVPAKTPVSYGGRYVTKRHTRIATVNIGYAHGLPRAASGKAGILVRGTRHAIAGAITMDYCMLDIGNAAAAPGDEAVALGCQAGACISADELARQSGTIGYEILCGLSPALGRLYMRGGETVQFQRGYLY